MADPTACPLASETETDRLRMALAQAEADLQRHDAALSKLQGELMASRLEVSGAREETVQYRGMFRRAEAVVVGRDAEIMRLHAAITTLEAQTLAVRAGMDLHASSRRISALVRVIGGLFRGIAAARPSLRRAIRRSVAPLRRIGLAVNPPPVPTPPPAPLAAPADPSARSIFHTAPLPRPSPGEAEGVVTLDALYDLSRSI